MSSTARSLPLQHEDMLARMYASDAAYDGRFITGVMSTGIYCLPSCRARKPRSANVRFFASLADARTAGLRPCRRCRPDDYYAGYDPDVELAEGVAALVRRDPAAVRGTDDMIRRSGVGATKLHALFRRHYHVTPAVFLSRARVDAARALLAAREVAINEVAFAAGFDSVSTFYEQFRRLTGLSPGAYRALGEEPRFRLRLPEDYSPAWALRVLARQPANPSEAVAGHSAVKVLRLPGGVAVMRMDFTGASVECRLESKRALGPHDGRAAHEAALRLLGLNADPGPFQRRVVERGETRLIEGRRGLRVPCTADLWEALVWAILGQQVNLAFACALRRDLILLCCETGGGDLAAHPTPAAVASLEPRDLRPLRFSTRKAEYLIDLARLVASGELSLRQLEQAHAGAVEQRLLALRGVGPWSAQYVLMRGLGFADCLPVGDAALTLALQRYYRLEQRPDAAETRALMEPFAPFRSLATFHLWQTLNDPEAS